MSKTFDAILKQHDGAGPGFDLLRLWLALAILFIDRFDAVNIGMLQNLREQNKYVIEVLTLRLMAGQTITGGWSYSCPILTAAEHQRLLKALLDPKPKLTAALKKMAIFQDPDKLMLKPPPLPISAYVRRTTSWPSIIGTL